MALDVEEAPAIAMVLEGASKKKPSPLSSAPLGDEEEEEAPDIEIDDAFVNATRAFTEAKSDEERAKALKGAIKLCLSEEGY